MNKLYKKNLELVDRDKRYLFDDALALLAKQSKRKFDETVDVAIRLGVDPKQADQNIRGTVVLPHGTGKKLKVAVFAKGPKAEEAKKAGADFVGDADLIEKVSKGFLDFDATVATPDMMGEVGKLGKVLGPRGLMPNPKLGTVTMDVAKAVADLKAGKIEYRIDKSGIVHTVIGKKSFDDKQLKENFTALMDAVVRSKPSSSKGTYLKSITLSSTMGPGIKLDPAQFMQQQG
ncbi:MAG: 50S ribosomal protein L1 [Deltaproteobacteria bacterium]|nr:50S ribosomal protein L1 [Deltaproteobacteria bacterium]